MSTDQDFGANGRLGPAAPPDNSVKWGRYETAAPCVDDPCEKHGVCHCACICHVEDASGVLIDACAACIAESARDEVAQAIHEAHTTMTYSLADIANGDTGSLDPKDCPVCTPPAPLAPAERSRP